MGVRNKQNKAQAKCEINKLLALDVTLAKY